MKKSIYILAIISLLFTSCKKGEIKSQEITENFCLSKQLKKTTVIEPILESSIYEQVILTGKVEYNENDLVAYKSLLQGSVIKVNFELGDYVKQGEVLALVKSAEIQGMDQEQKSIQNQINLLKRQLETRKQLLKDGLASAPEVSELEFELKAAKIESEKISNTLKMYRSLGNGQFQIVAAKSGYIVQKDISVGKSITSDSDETLFSISNLNQVWIMVNIYANNLKYVKVGDQVKVKTVAFPDRLYSGKIDKIYNVFDNDEHVTKARVVLENQDLELKPGLSADIIIDKDNAVGNAFAIPKNALIFENNKNYIVIYKNDCSMEIRKVTPFASNEEFVYVKERFTAEEKVIASNTLIIFEELNN